MTSGDQRYRVLFERSHDGVLVIDAQTLRVIDANPAIGTLLGVEARSLVGRSCETCFTPALASESLRRLLAAEGAALPAAVTLLCADGQERPVEVTVSSTKLDGNPLLLWSIRDATERRRVEQERESLLQALHQNQKLEALGQLAGGVSHDMKNVLSVVLSCAGTLREEVVNPVHRADLEQIITAAQRGKDLVGQLLAFARKEPARRESFDVFAAVREAAGLAARLLPPFVQLALEVPERPVEIVGDRSQLVQALLNLCVNARDAMPQGGTLSLSAADAERRVVIHVSDTGMGMSEEVRRHAFEPFFTTKPKGQGTGLGLSMVYSTTRAHGGDVRLESAPGRGTRFTLWLPHTPQSQLVGAEAIPPPKHGRALVVDDDENLRRVLGHFLGHLGFEVELAGSAEEALSKFVAGATPRIAVCDLVMPGTDGAETMRRLKQLAPSLPVIIASGFVEQKDNDDMRRAGASEVLCKPFSLEDLKRAVVRVLQLPAA